MLSLIPKRMIRSSVHDFTTLSSSRIIKATLFGKTAARKMSSSFQSPQKMDALDDKTESEIEEILRKSESELQIKKDKLYLKRVILSKGKSQRLWYRKAAIISMCFAIFILFFSVLWEVLKTKKMKSRSND